MDRIINADLDAVAQIEQRAAEGKNQLVELSPEFRAKAREAARKWAEDASAEAAKGGNEWPQKVADSIFAFQDRWLANSHYLVVDRKD
jgi:hypothetical protein